MLSGFNDLHSELDIDGEPCSISHDPESESLYGVIVVSFESQKVIRWQKCLSFYDSKSRPWRRIFEVEFPWAREVVQVMQRLSRKFIYSPYELQ